MMVVGDSVVFYTARATWTAGGSVQFTPMPVRGVVAEVSYRPGSPCGYDLVKLEDGRAFQRPDTYHELSPYDWTQVAPVRVAIEKRSPDGPALSEERAPQSVQEWIDECNRIERHDGEAFDQPRLPSGWWILPGLMLFVVIVSAIASCT